MPRRHRKKLPPNTNDIIIQRLSHEGRGIATVDGKTTFVFNGLPHETVTLHFTNTHSKFSEADAIDVTTPSVDRVTPPCPHFGLCGGCQLQYLSPSKQVAHKQNVLLEMLAQQRISAKHILAPLTADTLGYRRKARIGVKFVAGKEKVLVGFRERGNAFVADLKQCQILHPSIGKKIESLSRFFFSLEAHNSIPQLEIAVDDHGCALILRHLKALTHADKIALLNYCREHKFKLYLQPGGPETIRLFCNAPDSTDPFLHYQLRQQQLHFNFLPEQFTQVNFAINQLMINQALQLLELTKQDRVLDLFCGIGNFSLPLARHAKHVTGVEGDATAISMARFNALQNQLHHTDFITADLYKPFAAFHFSQQQYDKILLDPPRTGALETLPAIIAWRPKKLLYISCNPSTFVRDAAELVQKGYTLHSVGIMDMFTHTKHVETMALFV